MRYFWCASVSGNGTQIGKTKRRLVDSYVRTYLPLREDKNVTSARTSKKREKTIKSVLIDNLMICYFPYLCFNRDILKRVSFNLIRTSAHIAEREGVSSTLSQASRQDLFEWCRFEVPGLLTALIVSGSV